jgi:enoyl-CoA hydratase/carnithine racemase
MSADAPVLLRRDEDGIAWLTLNRPAQRNALSVALMTALEQQIAALAREPAIKVVVIGGAGPGFCAGHDLREMRANPGRQHYETLFAQCSRLMTAIVRLPKPVIASVHGIATAAGCQLVASCDLVDAVHARTIGLVNRVTAPAQLEDETRALARQIASKLPLAVALGKEAFYRQAELGLDAAYTDASEVMTRNIQAPETEEGIDAFLEKRPPRWDRD